MPGLFSGNVELNIDILYNNQVFYQYALTERME